MFISQHDECLGIHLSDYCGMLDNGSSFDVSSSVGLQSFFKATI